MNKPIHLVILAAVLATLCAACGNSDADMVANATAIQLEPIKAGDPPVVLPPSDFKEGTFMKLEPLTADEFYNDAPAEAATSAAAREES